MALCVEPKSEPIPGYRLIERLGRGGFGEVWKAQAPGGLLKAIKVVHGDLRIADDDGSHRAEQELQALRRVQAIRHPYLLSIERYDIIDGRLVIVTELADCNLFDRYLAFTHQKLRGIPRELLLRYLREAAEVLDLMNNQHQLQHLDIKPQNLFLIHDHVKVADFGLVKDLEGVRTTMSGGVTPLYAAPETFDGALTPYCDQYSLAIVYQELLTGHRPFIGTSVQQLMMQHLQAPPDLSHLPHSDRPPVARALAKKPENRHPTCMAFIEALEVAGHAGPARNCARVDDEPAESDHRLPNVAASIRRLEHRDAKPFRPETPPTMMRVRHEPLTPPVLDQPAARTAPPEVTGPGVLVPAVVIGVGGGGLLALKRLRQHLGERFGGPAALPHLRILYLDTDPADADDAPRGDGGLSADEVLLMRLNRASHYLKPRRNGRSLIEGWFDAQWLYRIPRNPAVVGQRALGRLAFGDHYATFVERLDAALEAAVAPSALERATRNSKLEMRTNRPRVYVVACLGGGTGGGMYLDVAYTARARLKSLGYFRPDVRGVLLLPPVETASAAAVQATANTSAGLTELIHYSQPDTLFEHSFDDRDSRVTDAAPPFSRLCVLAWEAEARPGSTRDGPAQAGDWLACDLSQPLGRSADELREASRGGEGNSGEVGAATFGLCVFSAPRQALLRSAAYRLCGRLVERWSSRDATAVRDSARRLLSTHWGDAAPMGVPALKVALDAAAAESAGRPPADLFAALAAPLAPRGLFGGRVDVEAARAAARRWAELLGVPGGPGGVAADALRGAAQALVAEWAGRLSQLTAAMIEQPELRVPGAEEAMKQLRAALSDAAVAHAEAADRCDLQARDLLDHFNALSAAGGGRKQAAEAAAVAAAYPQARLEALTLRHAAGALKALDSDLAEHVLEVEFCRQRLESLAQGFRAGSAAPPPSAGHLLPAGCATPEDAVDHLVESFGEADLAELDERVQRLVQSQFTALVHVCFSTTNLLANLEPAMVQLALQALNGRLPEADVPGLFFAHHAGDAATAVVTAFEATAPPLADTVPVTVSEVAVAGVPAGPAGERFTALARSAAEGMELAVVPAADEIVIYREVPRISLERLPQLGVAARQAERLVAERDRCPPHTRCDVTDWRIPRAWAVGRD
jgi:hypothetical protein